MHILCLNEILIGDHFTTIEMGDGQCFVDDMLDCGRGVIDKTGDYSSYRDGGVMLDLIQVVLDHFTAILVCWGSNVNRAVEAARAQERGIERLRDIRCADGEYGLILDATMMQTNQAEDFLKPAGLDIRWVHLHQEFVKPTHTSTTHRPKDATTHTHCSAGRR